MYLAARWRPWIVGLIVTGALVIVSHSQFVSNEKRLLALRVRDAGAAVAGALSGVQTPLISCRRAGRCHERQRGEVHAVRRAVGGSDRIRSRLQLAVAVARQLAGVRPGRGAGRPAGAGRAALHGGLIPGLGGAVAQAERDRVCSRSRSRGWATRSPIPATNGGYVVYAENALPANRHSRLQSTSAFAGLNYALYLGAKPTPGSLLVSNVSHVALPSPSDAETVPFGNNALTLAMSSDGPLAGTLPRDLPVDHRGVRHAAVDRRRGAHAAPDPAPPRRRGPRGPSRGHRLGERAALRRAARHRADASARHAP